MRQVLHIVHTPFEICGTHFTLYTMIQPQNDKLNGNWNTCLTNKGRQSEKFSVDTIYTVQPESVLISAMFVRSFSMRWVTSCGAYAIPLICENAWKCMEHIVERSKIKKSRLSKESFVLHSVIIQIIVIICAKFHSIWS